MRFPESPAKVYRESTADIVAFNFGVALRIIWEVAKPIIKWAALLTLSLVISVIYLFWQLLFGTMKK